MSEKEIIATMRSIVDKMSALESRIIAIENRGKGAEASTDVAPDDETDAEASTDNGAVSDETALSDDAEVPTAFGPGFAQGPAQEEKRGRGRPRGGA